MRATSSLGEQASSRRWEPLLDDPNSIPLTPSFAHLSPVCRYVVRDHILGLRWMNPNAVIYLREYKGQGTPRVEYELCE